MLSLISNNDKDNCNDNDNDNVKNMIIRSPDTGLSSACTN